MHQEDDTPVPKRRPLGWRPNPARPLTPERKQKFLEELSKHGIVGQAAKRASLHSHRGCLSTWYREREIDAEFAAQWDDALEDARGAIEAELHRRAVEGYQEPVYYLGKEVGEVTKYSDTLLLARIRAIAPEYRPQQKIEHSGGVEVKPLNLESLPPHKRALLRELLEDDRPQVTVTPLIPIAENVVSSDHDSINQPSDGDDPNEEQT